MQFRYAFYPTINPAFHRPFAARVPDFLHGRFYHNFWCRGDTMIMRPGSLDSSAVPLAVTTWIISDLVQAIAQAHDERIIDDQTLDTILDIFELIYQGTYIDADYLMPSLLHPINTDTLWAFLNELTPSTTWTWEGWLSLESHMNETGVMNGYQPQAEDDVDTFLEHIDENVIPVITYNYGGSLGSLGNEFHIDIDGVEDFSLLSVDDYGDGISVFSI